METIQINLYSFEELSEDAKKIALKNYEPFTDFIYDDAYESVKKFNELFGLKEGSRSWLDYNFWDYDDNQKELKGLRLRKYILNNFGHGLYGRKFYNSIGNNRIINHPCIKINYYDMSKGAIVNLSNFYYSRIQFDTSCVLTGVCYDDDLLKPIYDFIAYKDAKNMDHWTLKDIFDDCFASLNKSIESEVEYRNSDEAKIEDMQDYKFTENGKEY